MKPGRKLNPRLVVFVVLVAGLFVYARYIRNNNYERPTHFELVMSRGVRALDAGKLEEAEGNFLSAADDLPSPPAKDIRRGMIAHNMGNVRGQQRRLEEAESLYREALRELDSTKTRNVELEVAAVLVELASVRLARYDPTEAESLIQRAIEINERLLGKSSSIVANNYRALAGTRLIAGRPGDSVSAATRAAEIDGYIDSIRDREH